MTTSTLVLGTPGRHARTLQSISNLRAGACWILFATLFAGLMRLGGFSLLFDEGARKVTGFVLFAALVLLSSYARTQHINSARARVGAEAEERVAAVLESTGCAAVVHGALLGAGGDVDHVVIGPIVAAIETKHGRGEVRVTADSVFVGRKRLPKDPVSQLHRQTMALKRELGGLWVDSVLCVTGMTNGPLAARNVTVCSSDDLPRVLANLRQSLPREKAESAAQVIAAKRDTGGTRSRKPRSSNSNRAAAPRK